LANQFGDRIRQLREQRNLLLRQIAPLLEIDTPQLSKIERGERVAKRAQVATMCKIYKVSEDDLLSLWLADKIYNIIKNENFALKSMKFAEEKLKKHRRRNGEKN
jgi:HTH-type transcriptional regulator, competence development regulator